MHVCQDSSVYEKVNDSPRVWCISSGRPLCICVVEEAGNIFS